MTINIIGVSAHYHDAACCILRDGKLVAAAQEERFTRRKHDPSLPTNALGYCLKEAGLSLADIDAVAYYEDPAKKLARQLAAGLPQLPAADDRWLLRLDAARATREIRELWGFEKRIEFVEHHLSHAASAFYYSGWSEAAILTVDGVGEWATMTFAHGSEERIGIKHSVHFPDSVGLFYSAITAYLGFEVNDGEYKIMGLAPYGKPTYVQELRRMIRDSRALAFVLDPTYFDFMRHDRMFTDKLVELLGRPARGRDTELDPFTCDVARSCQLVLEEVLLEKVRALHELIPVDHLCMAGGVALNCVANERIRNEGSFKDLFIQPASSDAGSSLGAAAVAHVRLSGARPAQGRMQHAYLGPQNADAEIKRALEGSVLPFSHYTSEEALLHEVARALAAGQVIGWLHGRMEFGPRALGARSIIADPRGDEVRDRVNLLVKKREQFRPFAPAVTVEKASEWFSGPFELPFMTETRRVISSRPLPAITHVDGSARVQTVHRQHSPRFHRLLQHFEEQTGCPMLLNTSFNLRGEPIVCTWVDALLCFIRSGLDMLVLENCVIRRSELPAEWSQWFADDRAAREAFVADSVYTFL